MVDDAIQVAIIHRGNRAEMFISQKFSAHLPRSRLEKPSQSREPSKPALSYEHIENFAKDLEACEEALGKGVAEKKQILQLTCDWPEDSHWFSCTSS